MTLPDLNGGPFHKWLEWGHISFTIALCAALYGAWTSWRAADEKLVMERLESQAARMKMESKLSELEEANRTQDKLSAANQLLIAAEIRSLTGMIELERTDIRNLQTTLDGRLPRGVGNYFKREIERAQ